MGFLHYLLTFQHGATLAATPVVLVITLIPMRRYAATSWAAIDS